MKIKIIRVLVWIILKIDPHYEKKGGYQMGYRDGSIHTRKRLQGIKSRKYK